MTLVMKKNILTVIAVLVSCGLAWSQNTSSMPKEVYYLMPSFSDGTVYFRGQAPAEGRLNICAVDNTLRFLDKDGKELAAAQEDIVFKVKIDTVFFLRSQGIYYRMYPLSRDLGIALRRDVRIIKDVKTGAYGTESRTESIREYGTFYSDGVAYSLDRVKDYPYEVADRLYIYNGGDVFPISKKNLRKLFPEKKEEIDAFFKSGKSIPSTLNEALETLSQWVY